MINCTFENGNKGLLRHVAVDALILKESKILLVKRAAGLLEEGKWCLPGGYVERNENLNEAVQREALEETGYKPSDLTLFAIRDNPVVPNDDRQTISFAFFSSEFESIGLPDGESDKQKWFLLSKLPKDEEFAFDHLSFIKRYIEYKSKPFTLPTFI